MYNSTPISFRWSIPLTIEQEGKLCGKSPVRMWPWPFLVSHAARVSTGITSEIQNPQKRLSLSLVPARCCTAVYINQFFQSIFRCKKLQNLLKRSSARYKNFRSINFNNILGLILSHCLFQMPLDGLWFCNSKNRQD
jgi:hypothetical protein